MAGLPADGLPRPFPLTEGGEVAAYAVAHVIKVAVAYAAAPYYMNVLYQWAYGRSGVMGITMVSVGQGVVWAALGLALFLALRPSFGTLPAVVRAAGTGGTAGFEIGAYALAQAIGIAAGVVLFAIVMPRVYAILGIHGRSMVLIAVSIGVGVVIAAIEFVLFVHFRRAFAGTAGAASR